MEENTEIMLEDDSLGFDDADFAEELGIDNQTDAEEAETVETAEAEPAETGADGGQPEVQEQQEVKQEDPDADLPEKITCKFLKGEKDIPRSEIRQTLQKGLNHDRVVQQRDELRQTLDQQMQWRNQHEANLNALEAVAKSCNMDIPSFLKSMRVNLKTQQGMSREAANEQVMREDAERQLAAQQQRQTAQQQAHSQQEQLRQRVTRDMEEFQQMYPGVDIKNVPQSVIAEAASGKNSLVGAYARYENQRLQSQIKELNAKVAAAEQNQKNKQKSLGSVKSSGAKDSKTDDFLAELFRD